ncbi:MAG: TIGR04282 family arsenosugar biosynthesis glycosyltransferase [Bacteroidota bacterium]
MKKAIIIFVRHPELGKVKTRLAKDIGDEAALQVYKNLLQHTHDIALQTQCDRFVFYADSVGENDLWEEANFIKKLQHGGDLGERMKQAFDTVFTLGYQHVIIIGSDCPELDTVLIENAFNRLGLYDAVIGPATDGGYYLLGLKVPFSPLFTNKNWSTDTVLADSINDIEIAQKSYWMLSPLSDIDTLADLVHHSQLR